MNNSIIDDATYTGFHRKLLLLSSGGPFLDGYILSSVGVVMGFITTEFKLSNSQTGLVGACTLLGMFLGGVIFGHFTDRFGRKLLYTLDLLVLFIGSALCLFVHQAWQLIVLRLILGMAIGADYPIATAILSEWLPRKERGRAMGWLMFAWFAGAAVAYTVGWLLVLQLGDRAWRWVLFSAAIPAVFISIFRHNTPESPRWLASVGQRQQAKDNIFHALGLKASESELDVLTAEQDQDEKSIHQSVYRRRMIFVCILYSTLIIPQFALLTFGPQILSSFDISSNSPIGALIVSVLFTIGVVGGIFLVDKIGRRHLAIWSFACMFVPLALLGWFPSGGFMLIVICFIVYALPSGAVSSLEWIYPTELFPTRIRGTASGIITSITRIGSAIGTFLVPVSISQLGLGTTMFIGAGITLLGLIFNIAWAPETKGRSLHETSRSIPQIPPEANSLRAASRTRNVYQRFRKVDI